MRLLSSLVLAASFTFMLGVGTAGEPADWIIAALAGISLGVSQYLLLGEHARRRACARRGQGGER